MLDLARTSAPAWFTVDEVARAAGVSSAAAWLAVASGEVVVGGDQMPTADAVRLVRVLKGEIAPSYNRFIFNQIRPGKRETTRGVAASGVLHGLVVLLLVVPAWFGLADATPTNDIRKDTTPVRLVYLMAPGPGGGGGGGGLRQPKPAPPARKKAIRIAAQKPVSRVPPARTRAVPPRPPAPPRPEQRVEPSVPLDKPILPQAAAVQAPVQTVPADPLENIGLPVDSSRTAQSRGPGTGGGVGSGAGQGLGEGSGGGIGAGSGGGTGGGPYQPGADITPPTLVKEVRPVYTEAARRQAIEGDVVLEIVVRQDGSVGNVRVRRSLGAGLEQKAIEAVRQWRFAPAKRRGAAVDVVVDVSVGFKLR